MHVSCKGFYYCENISLLSAIIWCKGMSLGRVVETIVLDPSSNEMMLGLCPTDLVADHSARMPPEGTRNKFPLNASFVDGRVASFGAPPHSGPLLNHIFWSALEIAYIYFDHNMFCSGHLATDTPALTALCVMTLTNYATIVDAY